MAEAANAPRPGPYDHLTDEEKQYVVRGKCNFLALMLLTTVAFVQSGTAVGYCDFAARDVQFVEGFDVAQACASLNMTDWREAVCTSFLDKHGVGFNSWYATIPVDTAVCLSYEQYIPGIGIVEPDFDAAFNAGRVFAIMANIFGAFAFFTIIFASCCPMQNERLRGLSCYYVLAYICQAFTFLIFASDVCEPGFLFQYFPALGEADIVRDVTCSLGSGGSLSVSATCLYFICSLLAPAALAPLPVGYERMYANQPAPTAQSL